MKAKEQLLQELEFAPDCLIEETLDFLRFIKARERSNFSTVKSLLEHLQNIKIPKVTEIIDTSAAIPRHQ
jgi:hypothetical protein